RRPRSDSIPVGVGGGAPKMFLVLQRHDVGLGKSGRHSRAPGTEVATACRTPVFLPRVDALYAGKSPLAPILNESRWSVPQCRRQLHGSSGFSSCFHPRVLHVPVNVVTPPAARWTRSTAEASGKKGEIR